MLGGKQIKEIVLKDLHKEIRGFKNAKDIKNCEIILGEIDEPEDQKKISVLEELKKEEVIQNFYITKKEKEYLDDEGDDVDVTVIIAECKLSPQKLTKYITDLLSEKEKLLNKLTDSVTGMIDLIDFYIENPRQKQEEINSAYLSLSKEIGNLLKNEILHNLIREYKKPFSNIFTAEKELQNRGLEMSDITRQLSGFLGMIGNQKSNIKNFIHGGKRVDSKKILEEIRKPFWHKTQQSDLVITRDKEGYFCYKDKVIKFTGEGNIYNYMLECLCYRPDGFATYEQIDKFLVEKGEARISDVDRKLGRIRNGLKGLFRYSSLKFESKNIENIIRTIRGKGLKICEISEK